MDTNIILATDSYKLNHWKQYPQDTKGIYSYFESREGARFPYTVFFGLQYLLKRYLVGQVVDHDSLREAGDLANKHFGDNHLFNYKGWAHILEEHRGRLPVRIKAVPEGTVVPTGNVLMTVENTDPECFWLTNAIESLLTHVWYPSTVATLSRHVKETIESYLRTTADDDAGLQFMLHDFGYRGASSHETAEIGGCAHLVNFVGTDTLPAMLTALRYYGADLDTLAFSVPATEHSVMTSLGSRGEVSIVDQLLRDYQTGILSVVADSYDIYGFVRRLGEWFKSDIMERDGVLVVRPDSTTDTHRTPEELMVWIVNQLWEDFGGVENSKGFKTLDPHVRVLWGDGIDPDGIDRILNLLTDHGFSAQNVATFGMGGGLLQKVNRDTQRFAFKASSIYREGAWHNIYKEPLDRTKASKRGRLQLSRWTDENDENPKYETLREGDNIGTTADLRPGRDGEDRRTARRDVLETVFEDGRLLKEYSFDEIRERAKI